MLTKRSLKNITIMRKVYTPSLYYSISTDYLLCIKTVVNWSANTCPQLCMLQVPSHTWPDTVPPTTRTSPRPLRSNSLCAAFMGVIGGWSPLSLPFAGVWSCRLDKMCCTVRPWVARSHELRFAACWMKKVTPIPQLAIGNPRLFCLTQPLCKLVGSNLQKCASIWQQKKAG